MSQQKIKKLKWTKPYFASLGNIKDMTVGLCNNGSSNLDCMSGNSPEWCDTGSSFIID